MIEKRSFGKTKKGKEAFVYILKNDLGTEAHLLDFGAAIVKLIVPDKNGIKEDIVLGFDDVSGYEINESSQGVLVGRVANRIANAKFCINDKTFFLDKNDSENCLHSGFDRYGFKFYDVSLNEAENSVCFSRISPDMEQGFPGNLSYSVTYMLTDDNELVIQYRAECDKDTLFNPTNHSYFNLGGFKSQDISTHSVMIRSSAITECDDSLIPTGKILSVENTPMDLREHTFVFEKMNCDFSILKKAKGFDHNYILNHKDGFADAEAIETKSGRRMRVYTDMPAIQFYTANWLNQDEIGKERLPHKAQTAICFETQFYPNSCNIPEFPSILLEKGKKFHSKTIYKFDIVK